MEPDLAARGTQGFRRISTFGVGGVAVGIYWVVFAVKSIIFSDIVISGLFYPFYLGFLLIIAVNLLGGRQRVEPLPFWVMAVFLAVIAASFIGFDEPVDQSVIQGVIVPLMCPLVFLSIQSGRGIRTTATLSLVAGLAISIWIIVNSALSGFQYRGDVDINQNVAAFVVGLSLIVGISLLLTPHKNDGPLRQVALVLVTGAMGYAILLLASRGMTIALVVALFTTLASILTWHRGALRTALFALLALSATLLLPGGTGLFERFEGESVDSAGDRIPIWLAVVEDAKDGSLRELAFGHGFRASRPIVRSATGVLESTHNAYLALLYEYGTFGLSVFLALHGAIAAMALSRPNRYSSMAFGIVCFLLVANVSSTDHEDFMYWLALGFAVACVTFGWQAAGRTPPMNIERCNP